MPPRLLGGENRALTWSLCQATEERGENARLSSFVGAMALGDLVKSTLGPKVSGKSETGCLRGADDSGMCRE